MRGAEYEFAADATGNLNYLFVYEGGAPALLVRE
jgi:hypothetical protein